MQRDEAAAVLSDLALKAMLAMLLAALPAILPAAPPTDEPAIENSLVAMREFDQRVATIGYRLATANRELCAARAWLPGLALHDLTQYGLTYRIAAAHAFGMGDQPAILALARGGPAERAGLERDDQLIGLDGASFPGGAASSQGSFIRMEHVLGALDTAFADGHAAVTVLRHGVQMTFQVQGVEGCPTRFQVIPSRQMDAQADGRYVQVATALIAYAADDDELAAVIAHEFAHNLLHHRQRLDAAHVSRGLLSNFGRNARLIRETEDEADRLSVYLAERAGYDPEAAVRFWRRFGPRGLSFLEAPTHSAWRQRVAMLEAEIARISSARQQGRTPAPDFVQLPAVESVAPARH